MSFPNFMKTARWLKDKSFSLHISFADHCEAKKVWCRGGTKRKWAVPLMIGSGSGGASAARLVRGSTSCVTLSRRTPPLTASWGSDYLAVESAI